MPAHEVEVIESRFLHAIVDAPSPSEAERLALDGKYRDSYTAREMRTSAVVIGSPKKTRPKGDAIRIPVAFDGPWTVTVVSSAGEQTTLVLTGADGYLTLDPGIQLVSLVSGDEECSG